MPPFRSALPAVMALLSAGAAAQPIPEPKPWTVVKCERYRQAWGEALARGFGRGISPEFRARHDAFLDGGCVGAHDVCPRSEAEMNLANAMTVAAMNGGTASTFPPFGCPK